MATQKLSEIIKQRLQLHGSMSKCTRSLTIDEIAFIYTLRDLYLFRLEHIGIILRGAAMDFVENEVNSDGQ